VILSELDPGEQGTPNGSALQDPFFIRPLPSKPGDIADFPNTDNRHRDLHKMRKQRNLSQMKEQDKAMARDLSETDISTMRDREFKITIMRILTGLEKRVDNMSETLNMEIRNNIAEIKAQ